MRNYILKKYNKQNTIGKIKLTLWDVLSNGDTIQDMI